MNKNQFIYTRTVKEGETSKSSKASFNVEKVIRSITHTDGNIIVLLDDFNERVSDQPDIDPKNNKMRGYKRVRETVQSEIILSPEDGERFFKLTNIEL